MSTLELPHTPDCLVCGPSNPHGLKLSLHVDEQSGVVSVSYVPLAEHIGFEGIVHGGILATVVDEAMVWAATWSIKNFCVCGELSTRFRLGAAVGESITVRAQVVTSRKRVIETSAEIQSAAGLVATAGGKYIPVSPERNEQFMQTLIDNSRTRAAATLLTRGIHMEKER